ncbi:MAG: cytochrome P450, partial [Candidatus Eremiobacteraeota bacterium]|nr:cytochrome P450 [Candidatus Eremiobacteraeota bacterium]
LDTIGVCGFDYRFESFSSDEPHPFIVAMTDSLSVGQQTQMEHPLVRLLKSYSKIQRVNADVAQMQEIVDGIIAERKSGGESGADDLLQSMLEGVDPQSGDTLDDTNMRNQILTFLVAGHETTSGLLSFALYFLTENPDVLERAYREVDSILGHDLTVEPDEGELNRLDLVPRILTETLRLWPTAPMFTRTPREDVILAGKFAIPAGTPLRILIPMLHRDERVWPDPERFDPDRFLPEAEQARPPDCYKPFGTGQRACIGRAFALREATLVLAMVLQRYRFRTPEPYRLHLISTLTIKPADFKLILEPRSESERAPREERSETHQEQGGVQAGGTPLTVLYGSNMGTCRDFADRVAQDGRAMGFDVEELEFDSAVEALPNEGAVVAIVSSYNGSPPNNAQKFVKWLESSDQALDGLKYTVFGSGNRDWASTYQAVPRKIDERLEIRGGERIYKRGEGDAKADLDGDFEDWYSGLWGALGDSLGLDTSSAQPKRGPLYQLIRVEKIHKNPFAQSFQAQAMTVVENRELQTSPVRSTRHIELALPAGVAYKTGDHLGVLASNEPAIVRRVAAYFGFEPESRIMLRQIAPGASILPTDEVVSVGNILTDYLELQSPASREQIRTLAAACQCPPDRTRLEALMADEEAYRSEIIAKNRCVFDLLESCPGCRLEFEQYLEMMPALKPRYYSISSSPSALGRLCSITVGVVDAPARTGRGTYHGTASNFLASKARGTEIFGFVHDTGSSFRLPHSPITPIILVGAGTGVAPYRGFLQERAVLSEQGKELGPALLFFGFRHFNQDFLYRTEFEDYEKMGVARIVTAPSRESERKVYVQNRIVEEGEEVWKLLEQGGVVYVCGDASRMAPSVREAFKTVFRANFKDDEEASEAWILDLQSSGRYLTDVWASS